MNAKNEKPAKSKPKSKISKEKNSNLNPQDPDHVKQKLIKHDPKQLKMANDHKQTKFITSERFYDPKKLFDKISSELHQISSVQNSSITWTDRAANLFDFLEENSMETLSLLLKIYTKDKSSFYLAENSQKSSKQKMEGEKSQKMLIFKMLKALIVKSKLILPLERDKVEKMLHDILQKIEKKELILKQNQQQQFSNLFMNLLQQLFSSKKLNQDIILWQIFAFFLSLISIQCTLVSQLGPFQKNIIQSVFQHMFRYMFMHKVINFIEEEFKLFFQEVFTKNLKDQKESAVITMQIPLFDISLLSIESAKNQNLCKNLYKFVQKKFKQEASHSQIENIVQVKDKVSLAYLSILRFKLLCFESSRIEDKFKIETICMALLLNKNLILKLLSQIEKMDLTGLPTDLIPQMFQTAAYCHRMNRQLNISQIIQNIFSKEDYFHQLQQIFNVNKSSNNVDLKSVSFESISKTHPQIVDLYFGNIERSLFEIIFKIEHILPMFPLTLFKENYINYPTVFRPEFFISKLFEYQTSQNIKDLLIGMVEKWIHQKLNSFDFNFYLTQFFDICLREDKIIIMGSFIKEATLESLIAVNQMIFTHSFQEQTKKLILPEQKNAELEFASLTSAGFYQKAHILNKIMPVCAEQIMWRQINQKIYQNNFYIIVKGFYHAFNYEFSHQFQDQHIKTKIYQLISKLQNSINNKEMNSIFSIFHLLMCLLLNEETENENWKIEKQRISKRLFYLIIDKYQILMKIYEDVYDRRKQTIFSLQIPEEAIENQMKLLESSKKIHTYFMKSIIKFIDRLEHIEQYVIKGYSFQKVIDIIEKIANQVNFHSYHSMRKLSALCSYKVFNCLYHQKLKKNPHGFQFFLILRQILDMLTKQVEEKRIIGDFSKSKKSKDEEYSMQTIADPCFQVLSQKLQNYNQRETLKCKLIALQIIVRIKNYFNQNCPKKFQDYASQFRIKYIQNIPECMCQLIYQNPSFISLYQKELIINIRLFVLDEIFKEFKSNFSILDVEKIWVLCFNLCFDSSIQLRLMLINSLISRFKCQKYKRIQSQKYYILALMTIVSIYDPIQSLKQIGRLFIQEHRTSEQLSGASLIVLLISIKLFLGFIRVQSLTNQSTISICYFLDKFQRLWLVKKEHKGLAYGFIKKFLSQKKFEFHIIKSDYPSHIPLYHFPKEQQDREAERQIKKAIQIKPDIEESPSENYKEADSSNLDHALKDLGYYALQKMNCIISERMKKERVIKLKKEIEINWASFEKINIFEHSKSSKRQMIQFFC